MSKGGLFIKSIKLKHGGELSRHAGLQCRPGSGVQRPWWQVVPVLSRLNTEPVVVGVKLKTNDL